MSVREGDLSSLPLSLSTKVVLLQVFQKNPIVMCSGTEPLDEIGLVGCLETVASSKLPCSVHEFDILAETEWVKGAPKPTTLHGMGVHGIESNPVVPDARILIPPNLIEE